MDTRALIERMQDCFNSRRFDDVDDLMNPDFFSHPLGATGSAAGKAAWRTLISRFPDMHVVAEDIVVEGDKVAVRSTIRGTGMRAEGQWPALLEIFRIENGRFAEAWGATEGPDPRQPAT